MSSKNEGMQEKLEEIDQRISRYIRKKGAMPSLRLVMQARNTRKSIQKNCDILLQESVVTPVAPPEEVVEKGVYFKKQLYVAEKAINKKAEDRQISMPETIGFGEALPSERDVPLLLRKLETVDKVLDILIENNVKSIELIKFLDDREFRGDEKSEIPFTEIAVRIDTQCSFKSYTKILQEIGSLKPYIVTRDLSIKVLKENIYETSFVFSRLLIES